MSIAPEKIPLITPYGGKLVNLIVPEEQREDLRRRSSEYPHVQISDRAACDLELLATGGFSPLDRFMGREDYESVLASMRLANGVLFPVPILLPVDSSVPLELDTWVTLCDSRNTPLAVMRVDEIFKWDLRQAASAPPTSGIRWSLKCIAGETLQSPASCTSSETPSTTILPTSG